MKSFSQFKLYMWLIRGSKYTRWKARKRNPCYKIKRNFKIKWYDYFKSNRNTYQRANKLKIKTSK